MSFLLAALLGVMTVWDYPARQQAHEKLRAEFLTALRTGDTETMTETCRKGVDLLPEDPVWHYNLACSLAYYKDAAPALDELEKAIDLGYRDVEGMRKDNDLKRISQLPRFKELVEYADSIRERPIFSGPLAVTYASGFAGQLLVLSAQNLVWDLENGCFDAKMHLSDSLNLPYAGLLYVNRDGNHSTLAMTNWPGLTPISFDAEGRARGQDIGFPNTTFPFPVIGNVSRAITMGPYWRSLPRALMTSDAFRLKLMSKFYLSNQFWVYPAAFDCPPIGTNGNVFASMTPYWLVSQGRSWSDLYYLKAALTVWKSLKHSVREKIVRRGMWAPVVQMLLRSSLTTVVTPEDYFTPKANPTAFPPDGIDLTKLAQSAAALTEAEIPPVAVIARVIGLDAGNEGVWPELTYSSVCAWAAVLRTEASQRTFLITAAGGDEYRFHVIWDEKSAASVIPLGPDTARVTINKDLLTPTNRVDIGVYARAKGTKWSAPSFVSFAVVDSSAPYSDPLLTPLPQPTAGEEPSAPTK